MVEFEKVAILGAGCWRTHAATGITTFKRACEVADETGIKEAALTHSSITYAVELKHLAGVDEVIVSDPVFDEDGFTVVDIEEDCGIDLDEFIEAHLKGDPEDVMPKIRDYVNDIADDVPKPPKGAIHFLTPEEMEKKLDIEITTDDSEAVEDADLIISWLPKGGVQPKIFKKIVDDIPEECVVANTCTIPTRQFKEMFEDLGRDDLQVTSYHPATVPEHKGQVFVAEGYADDEVVEAVYELGKKARGLAFKVPGYLLGPVCDMASAVTAIVYAALLTFRDACTDILGAPVDFTQNMAAEALKMMAKYMEEQGLDKLEEGLDPAALTNTADSMNFGPLADTDLLPKALKVLEEYSKKAE
jgi:5,10-methenyltetrahydromethanopterin hydrogenase